MSDGFSSLRVIPKFWSGGHWVTDSVSQSAKVDKELPGQVKTEYEFKFVNYLPEASLSLSVMNASCSRFRWKSWAYWPSVKIFQWSCNMHTVTRAMYEEELKIKSWKDTFSLNLLCGRRNITISVSWRNFTILRKELNQHFSNPDNL